MLSDEWKKGFQEEHEQYWKEYKEMDERETERHHREMERRFEESSPFYPIKNLLRKIFKGE